MTTSDQRDKKPASSESVNSIYLAYLDSALKRCGFDSAAVFKAASFSYPITLREGDKIPVRRLARLLQHVLQTVEATEYPDFFLRLGQQIPLLAHGNVGAAMLACSNLEEVNAVVMRYIGLVFPMVRVSTQSDEKGVRICYQGTQTSEQINQAVVEILVGTTCTHLSQMLGRPLQPIHASFSFSKPPHCKAYYEIAGTQVIRWSQANNYLLLPTDVFTQELPTADYIRRKILIEQCETELQHQQLSSTITSRVIDIIQPRLEQSPCIAFVAEQLGMSERTLRRKLESEQTSFRALLKSTRLQAAKDYLTNTKLNIDAIASRLGYTDAANFRRAFVQDVGVSPSAYRRGEGRGVSLGNNVL